MLYLNSMFAGGSGHILDMVVRMRNNQKLLRKGSLFRPKRSFLNRKREYLAIAGSLNLKTATKEELAAIRKQIIEKRTRERTKLSLALISVLLPVSLALVYVFEVPRSWTAEARTTPPPVVQDERYHFFIKDGDSWLHKHHWHNARFQYNKALEAVPMDFYARHRIALTYAYECKAEATGCKVAKRLAQSLLLEYPNDQSVLQLNDQLPVWIMINEQREDMKSKACIEHILAADDSLGKVRNHACEQISLSATITEYTAALAALDYSDCPENFHTAFNRHRQAWVDLIPVTDHYPNLRGEMHDLFKELESSEDAQVFKPLVDRVWKTWADVEEASEG